MPAEAEQTEWDLRNRVFLLISLSEYPKWSIFWFRFYKEKTVGNGTKSCPVFLSFLSTI